jgi:hypothetical protein
MPDEPLDLDAIETYTAAATPGSWRHLYFPDKVRAGQWLGPSLVVQLFPAGDSEAIVGNDGTFTPEDAEFISRARQDLPRLVAEVRRLRARLDAEDRDAG